MLMNDTVIRTTHRIIHVYAMAQPMQISVFLLFHR